MEIPQFNTLDELWEWIERESERRAKNYFKVFTFMEKCEKKPSKNEIMKATKLKSEDVDDALDYFKSKEVKDKPKKTKACCLLTLGFPNSQEIMQFKGEVEGELVATSGCVNSPRAKSKQSCQPMNPHIAMSNASLRKPRLSALANSTETFFSSSRSILEWASGVQPGQMSMPAAWPLGPAFSAAGKREDPVPHPTSSTLAPGAMDACSTSLTPK